MGLHGPAWDYISHLNAWDACPFSMVQDYTGYMGLHGATWRCIDLV